MAPRVPAVRQDIPVAAAVAVAVTVTLSSAALIEVLTDRDSRISQFEWLDVAFVSLLSTFVVLWLLATLAPRVQGRRAARLREQALHPSASSLDLDLATPTKSMRRRLAPGRLVGGAYRCVPRAPFRFLMPNLFWRGTFRFWLTVLASDPDTRRGVRRLLVAYQDTYRAVDQAAIRYGEGVHVKHRLTHYHDFFVERVNAGERVLDIGSGKGEVAYDLATMSGAVVVGVDHDPYQLAFAQSRFQHPNLTFLAGDVVEGIPPGHFDVIVLSNVLEHLDNRVEFLRTLVSSATPTRLLFRVPVYERDWTVPLRDEVGLSGFWDSDHRIEYTPETFAHELGQARLRISERVLRWGEIWALAQVRDEPQLDHDARWSE